MSGQYPASQGRQNVKEAVKDDHRSKCDLKEIVYDFHYTLSLCRLVKRNANALTNNDVVTVIDSGNRCQATCLNIVVDLIL